MIDKCFRCKGEGFFLMERPDNKPLSFLPGEIYGRTFFDRFPCVKCKGSGVLEYLPATTQPVAIKQNKSVWLEL